MMRRSVQPRVCFGLFVLAVVLVAGLVVATGAAIGGDVVVVGAGSESDTAGGRSEYFGASVAGADSVSWVVVVVADVGVVCGAAAGAPAADSDRLREPSAWADAEVRSMAATRMILRM